VEKIAIAIANIKGGVGKTTLSMILTQIALSRGHRVVAVDLDWDQGSFTTYLANSTEIEKFKKFVKSFKNISDKDEFLDEGDVFIIDCPPLKGDDMLKGIKFADVILVPIQPDVAALANLPRLYALGEKHGKIAQQMPLVKIGFDETALGREIDQELLKMPWPVAATLPQDGHIRYNMSKGYPWAGGMSMPSRAPFTKLYDDILKTLALWKTGENAVWEGGSE
jgi:cellulose biosynthesis protein BcsQ